MCLLLIICHRFVRIKGWGLVLIKQVTDATCQVEINCLCLITISCYSSIKTLNQKIWEPPPTHTHNTFIQTCVPTFASACTKAVRIYISQSHVTEHRSRAVATSWRSRSDGLRKLRIHPSFSTVSTTNSIFPSKVQESMRENPMSIPNSKFQCCWTSGECVYQVSGW